MLPAASLARKVYLRQKLGVGGLRKHYGGKNKRKVCRACRLPARRPHWRKTLCFVFAALWFQDELQECSLWFRKRFILGQVDRLEKTLHVVWKLHED